MVYTIENDYIRVSVKKFGCELTSVYSKQNNTEYLWQGDASIWGGQSPILFPVIGRLLDDKYRLKGTEYKMPKHGFARKMDWEFVKQDKDSLTLRLVDNEETFKVYPYKFDLTVIFSIEKNVLSVGHYVSNKSGENMYFSIGAHPAFNCEIGDKLVFSKKETLTCEKIDLEKSLLLNKTTTVLNDETDIVITNDIFSEDALILSGMKSDTITLKSDKHSRQVRFDISDAKYLGIWAKPGAPYVCIEPWQGINDSTEKKDDLSQKRGIVELGENKVYMFSWEASII